MFASNISAGVACRRALPLFPLLQIPHRNSPSVPSYLSVLFGSSSSSITISICGSNDSYNVTNKD